MGVLRVIRRVSHCAWNIYTSIPIVKVESANTVEEGKGAHGENVLFLNGSVDGSTEKEEDMKKLAFDFRQRSCSVQAQWQLHAVEQQPLLGPFQQVMQRLHQLERICHEWGYYGKLAHGIDLS